MQNIIDMRRIDDLGRVVIPARMRKELGISEGDELVVELHDEVIIICKAQSCDKCKHLGCPDMVCAPFCTRYQGRTDYYEAVKPEVAHAKD